MKKIKITIGTLFLSSTMLFSQQPPTNNSPAAPGQNGTNAKDFWSRAGNSGVGANNSNNIFGTLWNSPVYHFTSGLQRMTLFDNTFTGAGQGTPFGGGLGINLNPASPITQPASLLTIGEGITGGWRSWMKVGTFNSLGSDNMYVGLKNEGGTDRQDAVINWGDNTTIGSPGPGPDYLRFIFTAPTNLSYPQYARGQDGQEVVRMSWQGNVGIGNYFNNTVIAPFTQEPARRLEILSDKTGATLNGNPLFRLTHTQQDPAALLTTGTFSEFQPMNNGNLFISVRDNTQTNISTHNLKERFTGFNTNTPGNTVEINSQLVSSTTNNGYAGFPTGNSTGWAGLRFTDLNSNSVPQANPSTNVLSINSSGDVILVPGGAGAPTANNGISVNTTGVVQLGVPCTVPGGLPNFPGLFASQLTVDRAIYIANQNFWFGNANNETGGVAVGGNPTSTPWCNINNTFEISANSKNPQYGSTDASGLRFTKLTSASPIIANTVNGVDNTKVLTVDGDGDVVLTDVSAGGDNGLSTNGPTAGKLHLGQSYGAVGNPGQLLDNREIPMNNFNLTFRDPSTLPNTNTDNRIELGNIDPFIVSFLNPKISSNNISPHLRATGGHFSTIYSLSNIGAIPLQANPYYFGNIGGPYKFGVVGLGVDSVNTGRAIGVSGFGYTNGGLTSVGVSGKAWSSNATVDIAGVVGFATGNAVNTTGGFFQATSTGNVAYGVSATARNAATNYGVFASVTGGTGPVNYGVYSQAAPSGGTSGPNYAGYFNGDLVYTGSFGMASDATLKTNIDTLQNAISIINQLKPKQFNFDQVGHPSMSLPSGLQYGLIAQDVETVLPVLVNNNVHPAKLDSVGNVLVPAVNFKSVEYEQLIPFLIKGMQQQQRQLEKQDSLITALTNQITSCCANTSAKLSNPNINQLDIELSDKDAIVLNQNVPNPFAEQTTITYNVPAKVAKAQILFYNTAGQIIQTVDIKTRGKGKVNVFASDLSSGLYHYTLVADGVVIDSKKMVRE